MVRIALCVLIFARVVYLIHINVILVIFILKGRVTEKEREGSPYLLVDSPDVPMAARAGLGQSQRPRTSFLSPCFRRELQHLRHHLLPPRMQQQEAGLETEELGFQWAL